LSDPQPKKIIDKLAQVWWGATMMGQGLENLPCGERLGELGCSSLERRWLRGS